MGANQSGREGFYVADKDVNFDHFHILRAIGKGSFGKVCIVQKKDTKQMFAMKYMNKAACIERDALRNVLREVELLTQLEHPLLVNIWFSFQDEEDLFMVSDLLLGGDLRYHIQHQVTFTKNSVILMVYEIASALDYLHGKRILHRDIKPDNILLDEEGHAHVTDFNIAVQLGETELATSMSGTKPYMSPEIFECAADICVGYSYPVDWWSLGIVAYEAMFGERPYDIHSHTGIAEVRQLFTFPLSVPHGVDKQLVELLKRLLCVSPGGRCSSLDELKKIPAMNIYDHDMVFQKRYKPDFCPPKDHLNCDPTFELEEMIVESKPLHKKKKRLAKQKSMREMHIGSVDLESQNSPTLEPTITNIIPEFITYNRYKELERREIERIKLERQIKEEEWEKELVNAMGESALSDKHEETGKKERSQDGCDILEVKESVQYLNKSKSEDNKCCSEKCLEDNGVKFCGCSGTSRKQGGENIESKKLDISNSYIIEMKKKHSKLFFDLGMFNLKPKSRSFLRTSSLRVSSNKDIPEIGNNGKQKEDTDNSRISRSSQIKNINMDNLDYKKDETNLETNCTESPHP